MKIEKKLRIGDLAKQLAVEKFVIRFWEKEFDVQTDRTEGGQRSYTTHDLKQFKQIKSLLYDHGMTIAGAKKILSSGNTLAAATKTEISDIVDESTKEKLRSLKTQLVQLKKLL